MWGRRPPQTTDLQLERDLMLYRLAIDSANEQDNKIWHTPTTGFTAQAFLLTVALLPSSAVLARCVTSALSALISLICMQLMQKHRFLVKLDLEEAHRIEIRHGLPSFTSRRIGEPGITKGTWLQRRSSYRVWMVGLALFGCASVGIFVVAIVHPAWLT